MDGAFATAVSTFRELGTPFWLAVALSEQGEWLAASGRVAEAEGPLADAAEIFARLETASWRERAQTALAGRQSAALV